MNQLEPILQRLGLKVDAQVLENLKLERLLRRERLLRKDGVRVCAKERPIEKSLQIILGQIQINDACWIWIGPRDRDDYGITYITGRTWRAHRFIFTLVNGQIPDGKFVLHRCDNPPCVRPDHLFLGTAKTNAKDAASKGRMGTVHGSAHWSSLLTESDVRFIREKYQWRTPGRMAIDLARHFKVSLGAIWGVLRRTTWKHLQ